jgi:large subunit ribosomal protein L29
MKRAQAHELNEDVIPAVVLNVSEQRLRELFPVPFSPVDSLAEPEPSISALVALASGGHCVVTFGLLTHRATISFPETADVSRLATSLLRETGIQKSEVTWAAYRVRDSFHSASAIPATKRAAVTLAAAGGGKFRALRDSNIDDLRMRERALREQLFKLGFQRATGRLRHPLKLRQVRREIARIQALLSGCGRKREIY